MIVKLLVLFSLWNHTVICLQASDFRVHDLPLLPKSASSIRMHAGHLPVNPQHHGALFFWHFANKYITDKSRTVIWLNGGPGCSSLIGAWMEIGPFRFQDKNIIVQNNGSWHLYTNLLFVDQPVGTGFSYINTDFLVRELDEMTNQFLEFLDRYIEIFPELLHHDIYLAGESFAGQYIPYIARAILTQRSALKLCGLLIGNGWIDPLVNFESYLPFSVAHNLVKKDSVLFDNITAQVKICQQAYSNQTHVFEEVCFPILHSIMKYGAMNNHYIEHQKGRCVNIYDVRLDDTIPDCGRNWPADFRYVTPYLHRKDVMSRIHVDSKKSKWSKCSDNVTKIFRAHQSIPSIQLLPDLLQEIPIMVYSGEYDLLCNHFATEKMIETMMWNNGTLAPIEPWIVEDELAGLIQTARNLTYILFYNASHMVPYDQARRSRVMLHQFMKLDLISLFNATMDDDIEVTTPTTHRVGLIVLIIIITILFCTCLSSFLVYKYRQSRTSTPFSVVRLFRSKNHNVEQQQMAIYSSLQASNEYFRAPGDETLV